MELPLLLPTNQQGKINENLFYDSNALYGRPALIAMPGLVAMTYSGGSPSGEVRGIYQDPTSGALYIVAGSYLYRGTVSGTTITIADSEILTGTTSLGSTGQVWMEKNEAGDLIISNASAVKSYDGSTLTDIPSGTVAAGPMCYMDKMFIMADSGGHTMTPSDVDEDAWDDFDGATPSGYNDSILNVIAHKRHVHAFGARTKEVFYNSGDATAPLTRVQGSMLEIGSAGPRSHVIMGDSIYWLTNTGKVARTVGVGGYEIVSNQIVENAWNALSYSDFTQAIGYSIQYAGHDWYCLAFPSSYTTYVFDAQTHELGLFPWNTWSYSTGRFRGNCTCDVSIGYQKLTLIGDYSAGYIYYLSAGTYQDAGTYNKYAYWYLPVISAEMRKLTHGAFELVTYQGSTPQWYMGFEDETKSVEYGNPSSITGTSGDTDQRFAWYGLGSSAQRKYRVFCHTQVRRVIFGASVRLLAGT